MAKYLMIATGQLSTFVRENPTGFPPTETMQRNGKTDQRAPFHRQRNRQEGFLAAREVPVQGPRH